MRITLFVIRGLFFLCAVGTGSYLARLSHEPQHQLLYMGVAAAIAVALILTETFFAKSPVATVSAITFGTIMGFLAAWLFTGLVEVVAQPEVGLLQGFRLVLTLIFVYLGITLLLQTKDDFRFIVPYVEFSRDLRGVRPTILDTSALIDGRFPDLAMKGLYDAPLVVPRLVVDELHALADSQDKLKRARGRRGLDAVKAMRDAGVQVEIVEGISGPDDAAPVDRKLVALARKLDGPIVTTDAGLQKVGELDGVKVLNVHEIAKVLQLRVTTGEKIQLRLSKPGEGAEQGVGYLDDGSMVVVEKARAKVGEDVLVEVTGNIRTSAGQMFFARIAG